MIIVDLLKSVPHFPAEDSKLRATSLQKRRGGNCPNTLEVLQQLAEAEDGANLIFLGVLPSRTSAATMRITNSLPGIDLRHCIYRDESTEAASSYIIKSEKGDSRTIVNYNELKEMTVNEFNAAAKNVASGLPSGGRIWYHFEVRVYAAIMPLNRAHNSIGTDSGHHSCMRQSPAQELPPSNRQCRSGEAGPRRTTRPSRRSRRRLLLSSMGRSRRLHSLQALPRGPGQSSVSAKPDLVLYLGRTGLASVAFGDHRACEAVDY